MTADRRQPTADRRQPRPEPGRRPSSVNGQRSFIDGLKKFITPPNTGQMPAPDDAWGAWVEYRLKRLEDNQTWILRVILGALVMQFALDVLKMIAS